MVTLGPVRYGWNSMKASRSIPHISWVFSSHYSVNRMEKTAVKGIVADFFHYLSHDAVWDVGAVLIWCVLCIFEHIP